MRPGQPQDPRTKDSRSHPHEKMMKIARTSRPPERLEGGGFRIRDVMSGYSNEALDPFLIWHELPRTKHARGTFPGAPMHPHRGFMECPYSKEAAPGTYAVESGGETRRGPMPGSGSFELGKVGVGMAHEMLVDRNWTGYLFMFQLWVNLPGAHKFDAPHFQNAEASALPVVDLDGARVKVMHGEFEGRASPTTCDAVPWQYMDFMLDVEGAAVEHAPPAEMATRCAYVYAGSVAFGADVVAAGTFVLFDRGGGALRATANAAGSGFLFIAGRPIGEPVVQHGPFVMNTRDQIQQCFADYQRGRLMPEKATVETLT